MENRCAQRARNILERLLPNPAPTPEPNKRSLGEALEHFAQNGFAPAVVVDVGVDIGTPSLYRFSGAEYFLIEPIEESRPFLENIAKNLGNSHVVMAAAGSKIGSAEIAVSPYYSGSTMAKDMKGKGREVRVVTVDSLLEKTAGEVLLKIDVQGFELEVLKGCEEVLPRCEVIVCECRVSPYGNSPSFFDIAQFMKARGFVVYDLINLVYRPSDGTLRELDAVFVKEEGRFRTATAYKVKMSDAAKELRAKKVKNRKGKRARALEQLQ
jgi:FkbM family methyltransferase